MALTVGSLVSQAQNHKFYLRAIDINFNPKFSESENEEALVYIGRDEILDNLFRNHNVYIMKKAFTNSSKLNLQKTWYLEGDSQVILDKFLERASHLFDFGEYLGTDENLLADANTYLFKEENSDINKYKNVPLLNNEIRFNDFSSVLFFPNDYGLTSPNTNLGIDAELHNYDYIGAPEAWEYTTGSSAIKIGLSDAVILVNELGFTDDDPDFVNKTTFFYDGSPPGIHGGHGYSVGMIVAGQGDNETGSLGVCYDCDIMATNFSDYDALLQLSNNGARVINCSWGSPTYSQTNQECINEITQNGTIVIAATHNLSSHPQGTMIYPAAYDNVIGVGGVSHKNDFILENVEVTDGGTIFVDVPKNYLGASVILTEMPTNEDFADIAHNAGTSVLGEWVDIVAPGADLFSYASTIINGEVLNIGAGSQSTSSSTPHVSGTVGLMLDINQCLDFNEVESIIKMASTYIGDIPANARAQWIDKYGSGALHTGKAVKLTNDLISPSNIAYLEDQKFTRWDFNFKGVSQEVEIRNQEFTESSTLSVIAKNRIVIEQNSLLEPNGQGSAILEINPGLTIDTLCDIAGFSDTQNNQQEVRESNKLNSFLVYPTLVQSFLTIEMIEENYSHLAEIVVYDLYNRIVYSNSQLDDLRNNNKINLDLSTLNDGIYLLKGYSRNYEELITEKLIKD